MENATANLHAKAYRATRNGREYLVAPVTLIVPGVLSGSRGPLYYPSDEVEKHTPAWNNVPIVVYHPTDNAGNHVSAAAPGILEKSGIGVVWASNFDGKHIAEGWFDVEKTKRVDADLTKNGKPAILPRLEKGEPIEVSTGLGTLNEETPGEHNGKPYIAIARNYKPDHLAVLPDVPGACSVQDGCGVNNAETEKKSVWQKLGELLGITNADQPRHPKDGTYQGKAKNAVEKGFNDVEHDDNEPGLPIDDEAEKIGQGDRPGTPVANQEPSDKVDPDKACEILHDGTARGEPLTDDQKKMFGAACSKTSNAKRNKTINAKGKPMPLTKEQKDALLGKLTSNCACDKTKTSVMNLDDAVLAQIAANMDDPEEDEEEDAIDAKGKKPPFIKNQFVTNTEETAPVLNAEQLEAFSQALFGKPLTEVRAAVSNAAQAGQGEKDKLITRLVANVQDAELKKKLVANHGKKDLETLRLEVQALPTVNTFVLPNYLGAAGGTDGGQTANQSTGDDSCMDSPVLNYQEIVAEQRKQAS